MNINNHINELDIAHNLDQTYQLVQQAKACITWWGERRIEVTPFEGSTSLKKLIDKVAKAGYVLSDSNDVTPQQRLQGIDICYKLKELYEQANTKITNQRWFIRPFSLVYGLFSDSCLNDYMLRFNFEWPFEGFKTYSKKQYERDFNETDGWDKLAEEKRKLSGSSDIENVQIVNIKDIKNLVQKQT